MVRWSDPREQNLSHTKDTINDKVNIEDNNKETNRPRRDAAVAGELRRLNDTDADPQMVDGGSVKFIIT